jgi:hypothetical protein
MQQVFDSGFVRIGLSGDGCNLYGQRLRCFLADAWQAMMVKFDEWSVE